MNLTISLDAMDIATDLFEDAELTYGVVDLLADSPNRNEIIKDLANNIFDDENDQILSFLQDILSQFEHLKEVNS